MTKQQLPGEVTYDNVKDRLAAVLAHIAKAESGHDEMAATVAEQRGERLANRHPVPEPTEAT